MAKGNIFLRTGQYVKMLPVVVNELVKVFSSSEDKDLLLYYIKPGVSCIMSFSNGLTNQPSRINAVSEDESVILLIPVRLIPVMIHNDPGFTDMFFHAFTTAIKNLLKRSTNLFSCGWISDCLITLGRGPTCTKHRC